MTQITTPRLSCGCNSAHECPAAASLWADIRAAWTKYHYGLEGQTRETYEAAREAYRKHKES